MTVADTENQVGNFFLFGLLPGNFRDRDLLLEFPSLNWPGLALLIVLKSYWRSWLLQVNCRELGNVHGSLKDATN